MGIQILDSEIISMRTSKELWKYIKSTVCVFRLQIVWLGIKFDVNLSMFTFHFKLIHTYSVATSNISLGFYKIQGVLAVFWNFWKLMPKEATNFTFLKITSGPKLYIKYQFSLQAICKLDIFILIWKQYFKNSILCNMYTRYLMALCWQHLLQEYLIITLIIFL